MGDGVTNTTEELLKLENEKKLKEEAEAVLFQKRWYNLLNLFSRSSIAKDVLKTLKPSEISGMVTDCENLDFFDPQMVNSLSVTQIDEIITEFYSEGDTCIIDIKPSLPKITIDQSINDITNERHK